MKQGIEILTELPGPRCRAALAEARLYEPASMSDQAPVVWDEAEGCYVKDLDGNVFLDFTSGVLVANVGHSRPEIVAAIRVQAGKVINCYDFLSEPRLALSKRLVELAPAPLDRAFILTTGAEATEAAIKLARKATGKYEIIAFWGAFHGRTMGALSLGGKRSGAGASGFGPFVPGIHHAPFPYCYRCPFGKSRPGCALECLTFLEPFYDMVTEHKVAAVIVETYQGGAGSIIAPKEWWQGLQAWCRSHDILLIIDEVQASFGRTGKWFAFEHYGLEPDLVCLGKGLSSSLPVSALLGPSSLMDCLGPGTLSSTHGGNPLGDAAALANIEVIEKENLCDRAARLGDLALGRMKDWQERFSIVGEARGMGLAMALELVEDKATKQPAPALVKRLIDLCYRKGLLLIAPIGTYGNCLRLSPPLVISEAELALGLDLIEAALEELTF